MAWSPELGPDGQNDALTWCQRWRAAGSGSEVLYLLPGLTQDGVRETTPQGWCNIFWGWIPDADEGQCRLELHFGPDASPDSYSAMSRDWVTHRQHGTITGPTFDVEEAPFGGLRIEAHHAGDFMVRCDRQVYAVATA